MQSGKSLKDQGKSRTITMDDIEDYFGESQSLKDQGKSRTGVLSVRLSLRLRSQSLKDQGKSRTLDSLAFARRQSFSLRKH